MRQALTAALLVLYLLTSGGVVLAEYSCRETGANGTSVPTSSACGIASCDGADSGGSRACLQDACCDVDLRVMAPDDQLANHAGHDVGGASGVESRFATCAAPETLKRASKQCAPAPPFRGFDRPIRD